MKDGGASAMLLLLGHGFARIVPYTGLLHAGTHEADEQEHQFCGAWVVMPALPVRSRSNMEATMHIAWFCCGCVGKWKEDSLALGICI
jgi:hypothetical protein